MASFFLSSLVFFLAALILVPQGLAQYHLNPVYEPPVNGPPVNKPPQKETPVHKPPQKEPPVHKSPRKEPPRHKPPHKRSHLHVTNPSYGKQHPSAEHNNHF